MNFLKKYYVNTTADVDVVTITHDIKFAIRDSAAKNGLVSIIVPESGAGLLLMEPLDEVIAEFKTTMSMFGGEGESTTTDKKKLPVAIRPRVQAALTGRTLQLPLVNGLLLVAPYEEVVLVDFDNKVMRREFIVHILIEEEKKEAPQGPQARGRR